MDGYAVPRCGFCRIELYTRKLKRGGEQVVSEFLAEPDFQTLLAYEGQQGFLLPEFNKGEDDTNEKYNLEL